MKKPTLGWQSWSPPYPRWHGLPLWDYSPFPDETKHLYLHSSRPLEKSIRYWCSWYAFDTRINDQLIRQTTSFIQNHNLDFTHILIDDGWCEWGDWLWPDTTKFSNLKSTISHIHQTGFKTGLWVSPFLADRSSILYKNHPDWFVNHNNHPIQGLKTMPLWEALIPQRYLLDFSKIEVQNYTKQYLKKIIIDWKVDLLKLDFLYAPYFDPNHTSSLKPTKHLKWLLVYLKENYPSLQTIACGAPFKDSSALVDAIRVSKDTALPPFVPKIVNKLVYLNRVKMLEHTLQADYSPHLNADPDVRLFSLDNTRTSTFWARIDTPIIGVGDNLLKLSLKNITSLKKWLKSHSKKHD